MGTGVRNISFAAVKECVDTEGGMEPTHGGLDNAEVPFDTTSGKWCGRASEAVVMAAEGDALERSIAEKVSVFADMCWGSKHTKWSGGKATQFRVQRD
nr:hypothetical protein CFP56_24478 [Quercus suber]